ncbi:unnamed protein product [Polarella glacialis]|uniref:Reverse transcriptase Ty1/copia-type domain-containing protein n=1 Tax=Polarella glacialis TaxID=89957 RepID=A0A813FFG4_POLGL|nr:unnamed protein product [Polarella glacialis]
MGTLRMRTDGEPAVVSLVRQVASRRAARTHLETTPVSSSSSLGGAERKIQAIEGQLRTLRKALEEMHQAQVPASHPIFSWLVRHACYLLDRFQPSRRHQGQTPYERLHHRPFQETLCTFGAVAMGRNAAAVELGRVEARWEPGVWLGRSPVSAEHILSMEDGIRRVRSIRLLPRSEWPEHPLETLAKWPVWKSQSVPDSERAQVEEMPGREGALERRPPFAAVQEPGFNPQKAFIRSFKADCGPTQMCKGCQVGGSGIAHTSACKRRQETYREDVGKRLKSLPPVPEDGEAELQEEQQPAAMEQQEEETVPLEQPAEAESADDMQDIRVPKRPAEREESPPRLRLRTPDLAETAGDTLHTVQQKYERDVHSEDQGHLFAANFLDTLAALVVADEPELFVGVDPGYDEQWRELPYEAVLQGRRKELTSMRNFKVYEEVSDGDLPAGTKVIPCRFLYKMKKDGAVKARLVVQQVRSTATGLGWAQTFAACPTILGGRVVVWCAEVHRWPIVEGDVSTAFLHAPLPDDDWTVVRPPSCIYVGKLWRLKKALYGLRVAPKIFQSWYVQQQAALNFRRCRSDPQVFWRSRDGAMHLTHADDVRITLPLDKVQTVQDEFKQKMVIRWDRTLGPTWTAYLGSFWRRSSPACVQVAADPRHVKALATMFSISLDSCKPVRTPMWPAQSEKESEPLPPHEARRFRTAVGILQWLALRRPDIQFSSKEVARGLSTPTVRDLARVKKLAKYVVTTKDTVLELETDTSLPRELTLYCDASYAGDEDQRKSTTGFALFLQGVLLLSGSKTQSVVALSTAEAELLAMNSAVKEALFARSLLEEVGCERLPIRVYSDSSAGLAIASRTGLGRLRHVQVQHLWLQDLVQTRDVKLLKIASTNNPADILTKQLPPAKVDFYRNVLCLQIVPDVFKEIQSNP